MTTPPLSATLGDVQLMAFTDAATSDTVHAVAKEMALTRTHIVTGTAVEAAEYLKQQASPEILLVAIQSADSAPAQLDALADVVNPHTKVLVTGTVDSIRFYQWLKDLGIEHYLLQPFTASELKQAMVSTPTKKTDAEHAADGAPKKLIAVMGARGGVGTTMIATNLGAIFAREHQLATAIIDLDPYFGSVALSMDLEPARGLRDAFEKPDRVDSLFLERVMVKPFHHLSVFGPEEPLMDPIVTQPNAGEMIFGALREKFQVMVVDVPRQMSPLTRYVLAKADHIIIIAEPQITSLRDSLRIKDYVVEHLKRSAPMLLLNRVGLSANNQLSTKEFAKNFGQDVAAQLPYVQEAIAATAQGELLSHTPKLSAMLSPLRKIAHGIVGTTAAKEAKPAAAAGSSLFARLSGKK